MSDFNLKKGETKEICSPLFEQHSCLMNILWQSSGLSVQISGSLNKTTLIILKIPLLHLYIKKIYQWRMLLFPDYLKDYRAYIEGFRNSRMKINMN